MARVIIYLMLYYQLVLASANQAGSLLPKQSLADGQSLLSPSKEFELGFFSPTTSSGRYLGIWYHKIPVQTLVWVANRNTPLHDNSGVLTIHSDGNIALVDNSSSDIIWSTNLTMESNNTVATIMDNGNFVLYTDGGEMGSEVAWQSFDHPTDTLLPGMRVGYDATSGVDWKLTSWKSDADPALGAFSFGLNGDDADQFFTWNGSSRYWRSGALSNRLFNQIPTLFLFHFSLERKEGSAYIQYSALYNNTRLKMEASGEIKCMVWYDVKRTWGVAWTAPASPCARYDVCGMNSVCSNFQKTKCRCLPGYGPAPSPEVGCRRRKTVECGVDHGYLSAGRLKVPDMERLVVTAKSVDLCRNQCSEDCNCSAFAFADGSGDIGGSCLHWYGGLVDVASLALNYPTGSQEIFLKLSLSDLEPNKFWVPSTIVIAVTIPAFIILAAASYFSLKKKMMRYKSGSDSSSSGSIDDIAATTELLHLTKSGEDAADGMEIPTYSFVSILLATNHFSNCNFLGQGGFGRVYKGKLPGDREIAVKRLSKSSGQGVEEFKNEVHLIAKLQHRNLVRLVGCCIEKNERLLIYEYMPNKSLDFFIFDTKQCKVLNWEKRFDIILGIARGLLYLHQDSRLRIIHRDLKTSNILLDGEMTPKISDFGLAKIFQGNEIQGNTKKVVGTFGYMSPEYALNGLFSTKSDVFSFGVIVLEMVSGMKNNHFRDPENYLSLLGFAWKLWDEEIEMKLLEPLIVETAISWQVQRCIQMGLLCVQEEPGDRPSMGDVIAGLVSETVLLPMPKGPATYASKYHSSEEISLKGNQLTVTLLQGR